MAGRCTTFKGILLLNFSTMAVGIKMYLMYLLLTFFFIELKKYFF